MSLEILLSCDRRIASCRVLSIDVIMDSGADGIEEFAGKKKLKCRGACVY